MLKGIKFENKIEKERIPFKKNKCEYPACKGYPVGLVRTKEVCKEHFNELKIDNQKRINRGIDIPNSFETLE
jgi:hypothetical protein